MASSATGTGAGAGASGSGSGGDFFDDARLTPLWTTNGFKLAHDDLGGEQDFTAGFDAVLRHYAERMNVALRTSLAGDGAGAIAGAGASATAAPSSGAGASAARAPVATGGLTAAPPAPPQPRSRPPTAAVARSSPGGQSGGAPSPFADFRVVVGEPDASGIVTVAVEQKAPGAAGFERARRYPVLQYDEGDSVTTDADPYALAMAMQMFIARTLEGVTNSVMFPVTAPERWAAIARDMQLSLDLLRQMSSADRGLASICDVGEPKLKSIVRFLLSGQVDRLRVSLTPEMNKRIDEFREVVAAYSKILTKSCGQYGTVRSGSLGLDGARRFAGTPVRDYEGLSKLMVGSFQKVFTLAQNLKEDLAGALRVYVRYRRAEFDGAELARNGVDRAREPGCAQPPRALFVSHDPLTRVVYLPTSVEAYTDAAAAPPGAGAYDAAVDGRFEAYGGMTEVFADAKAPSRRRRPPAAAQAAKAAQAAAAQTNAARANAGAAQAGPEALKNKDLLFGYTEAGGHPVAGLGPLFEQLRHGYHVVLFGYGHSGAGKTHTLYGSSSDPGLVAVGLSQLAGLGGVKLVMVVEECVGQAGAAEDDPGKGRIVELFVDKGFRAAVLGKSPAYASALKEGAWARDGTLAAPEGPAERRALPGRPKEALEVAPGPDEPAAAGVKLRPPSVGMADLQRWVDGDVRAAVDRHRRAFMRVRATPNNPASSRSHMYLTLQLDFPGQKAPSLLTIVDMAGIEDERDFMEAFLQRYDAEGRRRAALDELYAKGDAYQRHKEEIDRARGAGLDAAAAAAVRAQLGAVGDDALGALVEQREGMTNEAEFAPQLRALFCSGGGQACPAVKQDELYHEFRRHSGFLQLKAAQERLIEAAKLINDPDAPFFGTTSKSKALYLSLRRASLFQIAQVNGRPRRNTLEGKLNDGKLVWRPIEFDDSWFRALVQNDLSAFRTAVASTGIYWYQHESNVWIPEKAENDGAADVDELLNKYAEDFDVDSTANRPVSNPNKFAMNTTAKSDMVSTRFSVKDIQPDLKRGNAVGVSNFEKAFDTAYQYFYAKYLEPYFTKQGLVPKISPGVTDVHALNAKLKAFLLSKLPSQAGASFDQRKLYNDIAAREAAEVKDTPAYKRDAAFVTGLLLPTQAQAARASNANAQAAQAQARPAASTEGAIAKLMALAKDYLSRYASLMHVQLRASEVEHDPSDAALRVVYRTLHPSIAAEFYRSPAAAAPELYMLSLLTVAMMVAECRYIRGSLGDVRRFFADVKGGRPPVPGNGATLTYPMLSMLRAMTPDATAKPTKFVVLAHLKNHRLCESVSKLERIRKDNEDALEFASKVSSALFDVDDAQAGGGGPRRRGRRAAAFQRGGGPPTLEVARVFAYLKRRLENVLAMDKLEELKLEEQQPPAGQARRPYLFVEGVRYRADDLRFEVAFGVARPSGDAAAGGKYEQLTDFEGAGMERPEPLVIESLRDLPPLQGSREFAMFVLHKVYALVLSGDVDARLRPSGAEGRPSELNRRVRQANTMIAELVARLSRLTPSRPSIYEFEAYDPRDPKRDSIRKYVRMDDVERAVEDWDTAADGGVTAVPRS